MNDFGWIDINYYNLSEVKSLAVYAATNLNGKSTIRKHNICSWMESTGNNKSSVEISAESILFEYNAENKSKIISISGEFTNVRRNIYKKEITLAPYSSIVLFPIGSSRGPAQGS